MWGAKVGYMGFTTPSYSLPDLFDRIDRNELQLPDFQHDLIWTLDRIRSVIGAVLRGYPIGSLLALDTRNTPTRFKPVPVKRAPDRNVDPGLLLLDGHQRVTVLYHALQGDGFVDTVDYRDQPIRRRFYVDVRLAVSAETLPDEAVFSVDEEGQVRSHFGPSIPQGLLTREDLLNNYVVPVSYLLHEEGNDLLFEMAAHSDDTQIREDVKKFHNRVLRAVSGYYIPMIRLNRDTPQSGVGQIFAHANSSGHRMDVFELLTAVFANEDPNFSLADHWADIEKHLRQHPALDGIGRISFLRAVSLLVTGRKGQATGHRGDILNLTLSDYLSASAELVNAFDQAAVFLAKRCILTTDQVPYTAQLVPLAVLLARLAETPGILDNIQARDRLNQWFWSGVFGELYGASAPTTRAGRDTDQVTAWMKGDTDEVPKTVRDAEFHESRLVSATKDSGVYRGIYALLMARGARDWRTGDQFNQETLRELEPGFCQIFPQQCCEQQGIAPELAVSVLNRTPMGKRTEIMLDGGEPKRYLRRIQSKSIMEDDEFDAVLATHELQPEHLFGTQCHEFFEDRRERFVGMVEYAMDKPVIRDGAET
ncbi:hypothetical protein CCYS_06485 [Corynebacterium cystitidis DSM 20524]|uniref:GmrSD restriction endonucleases N-terminal domain-containing protein n=2 Tax=Corynebacterium cystitidis TaxID=35757 RepID=A0A1H9S817_9CORY|nr:hypothetical protein CCYS_06485 [Corynebacterium cystitidis DSM 20524]SER80533.1 hypothetical protein SAMN05661109_01072 [Corynebacterium cystitidis DSM 20524]SNV77523.1 Uncharacterized conserved protein [Corynebacterium cystitidis]